MDIIEISHLKKYFGDVKAVDDISFTVQKGEFFAFLGVNGAGKSTTISVLCGKLHADGGYARINGKDGVVLSFSKQSTYATATVSDNLNKKFK